jgi:hypothetical protein
VERALESIRLQAIHGYRKGRGRMSTLLLLGGMIVVVIIVGTALELWENRRIDREAH